MKSIGIVGNGFVGNAVYQNLRDKVECKVFDADKNRSFNKLEEVITQDFISSTGQGDIQIIPVAVGSDFVVDFFEDAFNFVVNNAIPLATAFIISGLN